MRTRSDGASIARLAALLADPTRAGMCLALLDGTAWTAGELATTAGVARSTASEHLDQLVAGGLLAQERQGRHRYLRIATPAAAALVESLAVQPGPGAAPRSLRAVTVGAAMARGRTCYDHLGGRLGVAVMDALVDRGLVEVRRGVSLTDGGQAWFLDLGVDVDALARERRPLVRSCLDWTERRPHLAGAAGAALCARFTGNAWVVRGGGRTMQVTDRGARALRRLLGITPGDLRLRSTP
ncbi:MAG: winged helix-turn-helix domain-containing protein [Sporichthyaceae bacterium]